MYHDSNSNIISIAANSLQRVGGALDEVDVDVDGDGDGDGAINQLTTTASVSSILQGERGELLEKMESTY